MTDDRDPGAEIVDDPEAASELVVVPDPETHIDIEEIVQDLEIGELKLLEKATGLKLARILREFETNEFGADVIAAVVWISLKRLDPEATIEDADKIKLRRIAEPDDEGDDEGDDEVPDPS